jgi:isopenicillin-N epimerase
VLDAVLRAVGPRTRLALVDHVTSPTGLVLPLARLVAELAARGVDALVDGAHAPGMLPLDLRAIGAAYYAGNCHKWLCAPKGAGFLHVGATGRPTSGRSRSATARTRRAPTAPRFLLEFDWTGFRTIRRVPVRRRGDPLPRRAPARGWPGLMARNHALALAARDILARALGVRAPRRTR